MVFNTFQEMKLAEELVKKLKTIDSSFIDGKCFDSSIQNFLMCNQGAIETRDLSKFDSYCIMNGIHQVSKPIGTMFQLGHDPEYIWKLWNYLVIVYSPFYELSEEKLSEIKMFLLT